MSNIKFVYLYRDGANFKSWGEVVFLNSDNLAVDEIETKLRNAFISEDFFIVHQISIPEQFSFLSRKFTKHDHCYHEFDCVEICDESSTDSLGRSIANFLQDVESASKQGWKAFDILERS